MEWLSRAKGTRDYSLRALLLHSVCYCVWQGRYTVWFLRLDISYFLRAQSVRVM